MAAPDFNKKTVETLAKRARYLCSNPDCRVSTVGPNSDPEKATVIGEAAHIFGARPNAKRFVNDMGDPARASITNGIWLCRNCHKCIDTDGEKYSSEILFLWREEHEKYVQADLGNKTDKIRYEQQNSSLSLFKDYPPLIRRIVIDKPDGWEWRLTAELMRYLNKPHFRKLKDLRDGTTAIVVDNKNRNRKNFVEITFSITKAPDHLRRDVQYGKDILQVIKEFYKTSKSHFAFHLSQIPVSLVYQYFVLHMKIYLEKFLCRRRSIFGFSNLFLFFVISSAMYKVLIFFT